MTTPRQGCGPFRAVSSPFINYHVPVEQRMRGPAGYFLMARAKRQTYKASLDLVIDPCIS